MILFFFFFYKRKKSKSLHLFSLYNFLYFFKKEFNRRKRKREKRWKWRSDNLTARTTRRSQTNGQSTEHQVWLKCLLLTRKLRYWGNEIVSRVTGSRDQVRRLKHRRISLGSSTTGRCSSDVGLNCNLGI